MIDDYMYYNICDQNEGQIVFIICPDVCLSYLWNG